MEITKEEYLRRKHEVDKYLNATSLLDKGRCEIICTDLLGEKIKLDIDDELSRIMKANTFILLYNLVESTVTNSIKAIVNAVISEKLTYESLSEQIKHLWIRHSIHEVKDVSQFHSKIHELAKSLVEKELLTLSTECVNISGNIDAQKIRDIAKQVGWEQSRDGRELLTIKTKRNHLAHGQFTFVEVGKDYTISDLERIKEKTFEYLDDVLSKADQYIMNKQFKLSHKQ